MILFRKKEPDDEGKPAPHIEEINFVAKNLEEVRGNRTALKKPKGVADLVQFYIGSFDGSLDSLDYLCLQRVEDMLLRRGDGKRGEDKQGSKTENRIRS